MHSALVGCLLAAMLTVAVYTDLSRHRIPNELNIIGLCAGLLLQGASGGFSGFFTALLGGLVGLACFLPLYVLRGMGAGDVKLLAAVGTFLGPQGAAFAALFSLLAGGLGAGGYVLWCTARACVNALWHEGASAAGASAFVAARLARRDRLPFAVPIAAGSLAAAAYSLYGTAPTQWLSGTL